MVRFRWCGHGREQDAGEAVSQCESALEQTRLALEGLRVAVDKVPAVEVGSSHGQDQGIDPVRSLRN